MLSLHLTYGSWPLDPTIYAMTRLPSWSFTLQDLFCSLPIHINSYFSPPMKPSSCDNYRLQWALSSLWVFTDGKLMIQTNYGETSMPHSILKIFWHSCPLLSRRMQRIITVTFLSWIDTSASSSVRDWTLAHAFFISPVFNILLYMGWMLYKYSLTYWLILEHSHALHETIMWNT